MIRCLLVLSLLVQGLASASPLPCAHASSVSDAPAHTLHAGHDHAAMHDAVPGTDSGCDCGCDCAQPCASASAKLLTTPPALPALLAEPVVDDGQPAPRLSVPAPQSLLRPPIRT